MGDVYDQMGGKQGLVRILSLLFIRTGNVDISINDDSPLVAGVNDESLAQCMYIHIFMSLSNYLCQN